MIKPSRIVVSTWSALALALCMSVGTAAAQQPAAPPPAPAPPPGAAPATPPPGAPAVVDAPPPPPGSVYTQPAPPPYYAQQPVYAPQQPYQAYPQPVPRRFRPRRGLMIGGIAMLGASYIVSVVSGAVLMDIKRSSCDRCKDVGPLLFIPLAGPFLGISQAKTGDAFLVLLGILQVAGTALTVGGVVQYQMSKKQAAEQGLYTLHLPHDRSLSFDLSTSPARLGPSAHLRF